MKKMILGLALCFGLSNIAVAADNGSVNLTDKETKGALAWIKNNPKKAALIAAGLASVLAGATYTTVKIVKFDGKDGKWAKVKGGTKEAMYNIFVSPVVATGNGFKAAGKWTKDKAVSCKDACVAHPYITVSGATLIILAASVIADYATTDKEAQMRITQLWNKLFGKEVVA